MGLDGAFHQLSAPAIVDSRHYRADRGSYPRYFLPERSADALQAPYSIDARRFTTDASVATNNQHSRFLRSARPIISKILNIATSKRLMIERRANPKKDAVSHSGGL